MILRALLTYVDFGGRVGDGSGDVGFGGRLGDYGFGSAVVEVFGDWSA